MTFLMDWLEKPLFGYCFIKKNAIWYNMNSLQYKIEKNKYVIISRIIAFDKAEEKLYKHGLKNALIVDFDFF